MPKGRPHTTPRPWTDADDEILKKLFGQGLIPAVIARRMDRTIDLVCRHLAILGLRDVVTHMDRKDLIRIETGFIGNEPVENVAKDIGRSCSRVYVVYEKLKRGEDIYEPVDRAERAAQSKPKRTRTEKPLPETGEELSRHRRGPDPAPLGEPLWTKPDPEIPVIPLPEFKEGGRYWLTQRQGAERTKGRGVAGCGLPEEIFRTPFKFLKAQPGKGVIHFLFGKRWGTALALTQFQIMDFDRKEAI